MSYLFNAILFKDRRVFSSNANRLSLCLRLAQQTTVNARVGREQTVQMLSMFFENTNWVDSKTYRLGMVDNILIQVEDDTYETQTGPSTVRTLNLYEFKDGKRWRNWKFFPVEQGQGEP